VFAEIPQFHPKECLAITWFVDALIKSLNALESVEVCLRAVSGLANAPEFTSNTPLMKRLTKLLISEECCIAEMRILMQIFLKISPRCALTDAYSHLLQAAESRVDYCSAALRALALQRLPTPATRYSKRLLNVVVMCLASGDAEQEAAAAEIMSRMVKRPVYVSELVAQNFQENLGRVLVKTQNAELFQNLLGIMQKCGMKASRDVAKAGRHMVKALKGPGAGAAIVKLLDQLK
jgi:hypothetical protein